MKLNLTKPIAFFDLETTGLSISDDRIVEIAIHKVNPDGTEEKYVNRINPGIKIPKESTEIHGISDDDVKDSPSFKEEAQTILEFLGHSDLAGYNSNKFDVPFLLEEFYRNGFELDMEKRKSIDVQTIFHKMEQRTLAAALKFYCNKDLTNAHSADADAVATYHILQAQLDKYPELKNDVSFLEDFTNGDKNKKIDFVGRLALNEKSQIVYNFGKNTGKTIEEVMKTEPGYHRWIIDNDFPTYTKKLLEKEVQRLQAIKKNPKESITSKLDQLKQKFNS